jgi:signal transduction histidine kinase
MIGLSVFLFLFNLFLFIQMRERLYVLYGLYIFMGVFYMFSDYGYSYMFLFPEYPRLGDFTRPVALSLALPLFFLFCVELLNTKKHFPVQHRWLMRCFVGYLCIFLASIPFMPRGGNLRVILLLMLQCFQFVIVGWILLAAFLSLRKQFSYAPYIIAATLILLGTGTAYSFFIAGVLEDNFLTRNLMNMGFSGEVTIIAFVLSLRFKNYKEQTEKLIRQASLQQEQIFRTITDYQEKELQRISSLLHDSLGAHLSALRLKLESAGSANGQLAEAITGITDMSQELRVLAHNLSPALLQKKGLAGALQHQVDYINSTKRIHIQFEVIGSVDRIPFRYELLIYNIIQELIQNIIKHSQASEAIVQLLLDDGLASIFVEDNGKGCEIHKIKDGLGFTQIKQLVTFVKGHLQINAVVNAGCKVSIEFALLADERNNSHSYR